MQGQLINFMRGAPAIGRIGEYIVNGQQTALHHPRAPIAIIGQSGRHGMAAIDKHKSRCRHRQARHHMRRAERGNDRILQRGVADIGAKLQER